MSIVMINPHEVVVTPTQEWVVAVDGYIPVPGPEGPPGPGLGFKGELTDVADLPMEGNHPGDAYLVNGDVWAWTGTEWQNIGHMQGPVGPPGPQGVPGPTGPTGPAGPQGATGPQGPIGPGGEGSVGPAGPAGPSGPQGVPGPTGPTGPQGVQGNPGTSTIIIGEVATVTALPPASSVRVGDSYIVTADGDLYVSTGTAWVDAGQIVGPQGPTGPTGSTGPAGPTGATGPQGPTGAASTVPGPQGDQGEAGGALLAAFWQFSNTTTAPPAVGQVRSNATNTVLWVHKTDTDGFDRSFGLSTVAAGNNIYVRAANGTAMNLLITAVADSGTYVTFTTTVSSGTITKGARTQLNFVLSPPVGIPSGGTVNQVLGKTSSVDYATSWRDEAGGVPTTRLINTTAPLTGGGDLTADRTLGVNDFTSSVRGTAPASGGGTVNYLRADGTWAPPPGSGSVSDPELTAIAALVSAADQLPYFTGSGVAALTTLTSTSRSLLAFTAASQWRTGLAVQTWADGAALARSAPPRRGINASVVTTYSPGASDENTMTTLSNAAAITVTLPSNATTTIPVGAEYDFLWLGVGQPTFVAGSGATVNGTPGLKMRARYSAATAKKIATDDWVVIGDLSA